MPKRLNGRQKEFVRLYLSDPNRNASEAYRKAGYKDVKNSNVCAAQLLATPSIKAIIEVQEGKINEIAKEKFEIDQTMILANLAEIAFTKATEIVSWEGDTVTVKPTHELTDRQRASVASATQGYTETGKKYVKLQHEDRVNALKLLGQHLGMWGKKDESGDSKRDTSDVLRRVSDIVRKRQNR